jgi:hypothetical protein
MCGGGVGEMGGRGAGGDNSYNTQTSTLIDQVGRHCPTAAMGRHYRLLGIEQSANILCNRTASIKLEKTIIIYVHYLV